MKELLKVLYTSLLFLTLSCTNSNSQNQDIDAIIANYENEDFSTLKGVFLSVRQSNPIEVNYIVEKSEGNLPLYFVTYNVPQNTITKINNSALVKAHIKDYFTKEEIEKFIAKFREYNFGLIHVDSDGNVFINPSQINSPATLFRLNNGTDEKEIKKGYIYQQYKGRWYSKK